jgi:hypothetical protein
MMRGEDNKTRQLSQETAAWVERVCAASLHIIIWQAGQPQTQISEQDKETVLANETPAAQKKTRKKKIMNAFSACG